MTITVIAVNTAKRAKAGRPFTRKAEWNNRFGYCEARRLDRPALRISAAFRRQRNTRVTGQVLTELLAEHPTSQITPLRPVFREYGDVAITVIDGVAHIESRICWRRPTTIRRQRRK